MNRNPLVTVLMPCFNGGVYLRPTMESIIGQSFKEFEFLIINDCSTDDTLETIRSFGDPRIRVHTNPVNMGQTKSLNVGLRLARGKYIVVNDADDYSLPRRIETQLDYIIKNPETLSRRRDVLLHHGPGREDSADISSAHRPAGNPAAVPERRW